MSKRKTKNNESMTVPEFRQWLSGVEDMQPDGWVPNAEQWKKIRAKIASLSEDSIVEETVYQQPPAFISATPQIPQYQQYPQVQQHPRPPQTSLGDELFIPSKTPEDVAFDGGQHLSNPGVTQFS